MVLFLDGSKIKSKDYSKEAMLIEKEEKCTLSSAFSMVGDALEKRSKIFKLEGFKKSKKEIPTVTLL